MGLVRSDVSTEGCVHAVFQLTLLKSRPDEWRHAANESQAGVGICTGSCCSMALPDEVSEPPYKPVCTVCTHNITHV